MRYYEMIADMHVDGWLLGGIIAKDEWDFWKYTTTEKVDANEKDLGVEILQTGPPLDISFATFNILVFKENMAQILGVEKDLQLIPVMPEKYKGELFFYIAVVLNAFECLDENKSTFLKFEANDPVRPDLEGHYRAVYNTVLETSKIPGGINIFKLKKFESKILVSERVKEEFECRGLKGVKFELVTE